jgi:hypothetical protein
MSKFFIFILLFFLSSSCSLLKNKDTRRGDFVSGCFTGFQSSYSSSLSENESNKAISYCLYLYDSKKEKLNKILDSTNEALQDVPPQLNFNPKDFEESHEESSSVIFI